MTHLMHNGKPRSGSFEILKKQAKRKQMIKSKMISQ